jgi:hypothetical protein
MGLLVMEETSRRRRLEAGERCGGDAGARHGRSGSTRSGGIPDFEWFAGVGAGILGIGFLRIGPRVRSDLLRFSA